MQHVHGTDCQSFAANKLVDVYKVKYERVEISGEKTLCRTLYKFCMTSNFPQKLEIDFIIRSESKVFVPNGTEEILVTEFRRDTSLAIANFI